MFYLSGVSQLDFLVGRAAIGHMTCAGARPDHERKHEDDDEDEGSVFTSHYPNSNFKGK